MSRYYIDKDYFFKCSDGAISRQCERNAIVGFSPSSGRRMASYLRNSVADYKVMGTLTYPVEIAYDGRRLKRDLDNFGKSLKRAIIKDHAYPDGSGRMRTVQRGIAPSELAGFSLFWFLECQTKTTGNAHYHFFSTHFVHYEVVRRIWRRVIGADSFGENVGTKCFDACCKMELIKGGRHGLANYAKKYAQKQEQKHFELCRCGKIDGRKFVATNDEKPDCIYRLDLRPSYIYKERENFHQPFSEKIQLVFRTLSPSSVHTFAAPLADKFLVPEKNCFEILLKRPEKLPESDFRCSCCGGFREIGRFWGILGNREVMSRSTVFRLPDEPERREKSAALHQNLQKTVDYLVGVGQMTVLSFEGATLYKIGTDFARRRMYQAYDALAVDADANWLRKRVAELVGAGFVLQEAYDLMMCDYDVWGYKCLLM